MELFYPAVMKVKKDLVLEGYEEHAVARFALMRLWETVVSDQTFEAKVVTLKEIIEHHAEEEEGLLPKAEKALGDRSEVLGAEMKALYLATMEDGYVHAVGRGGSAATISRAPSPSA